MAEEKCPILAKELEKLRVVLREAMKAIGELEVVTNRLKTCVISLRTMVEWMTEEER